MGQRQHSALELQVPHDNVSKASMAQAGGRTLGRGPAQTPAAHAGLRKGAHLHPDATEGQAQPTAQEAILCRGGWRSPEPQPLPPCQP